MINKKFQKFALVLTVWFISWLSFAGHYAYAASLTNISVHDITRNTFCVSTEWESYDGKKVGGSRRCYEAQPDEINLAIDKILYANWYPSLNWAAQKRYHEELLKIKTTEIRR